MHWLEIWINYPRISPYIQGDPNVSVHYHISGNILNIGNQEKTFMKRKKKGDAFTHRTWRHILCLFTGYMFCIAITFLQLKEVFERRLKGLDSEDYVLTYKKGRACWKSKNGWKRDKINGNLWQLNIVKWQINRCESNRHLLFNSVNHYKRTTDAANFLDIFWRI